MSEQIEGNANQAVEGQNNQPNLEERLKELESRLESEMKSKERILEESKKYKEGYQSFKAEKEQLDAQKAKEEEERLREQGQYNILLEQREAQLKELESQIGDLSSKLENKDTTINNFKKAVAFERALGGKIKNEKYWSLVDFDKIAINPNTGSIDNTSLKNNVESFLSDHKELVDFGNAANLPNGGHSGGSKYLTVDQWKALPLKERKKRMKDVKRS